MAITVGAALSLSGRFAIQGQQAQRGLTLWAADTNVAGGIYVADRSAHLPVELLIFDDASRSAQAVAASEHLIGADRVDLLVGPYSSVLTLAVAPVAERHRKVLWNHGGSTDAVTSQGLRYLVNLLSPASHYFTGVLDMARELDPAATRVALLHGVRGTFPQAVIGGAETYARQQGLQIVCKAPYPPLESDFTSLAAQVAALHPDIILGVGQTEADLAFARQLTQQRSTAVVIGLVAAPIALFPQTLGADAHGMVGPSQWEPGVRYTPELGPTPVGFTAHFRHQFQVDPDYVAAQAYAIGLVIQRCIELTGTLRDESLLEAARILDLTTFYGNFKLDRATGAQIGHRLVVVQWQHGAKRIVWPPAAAEQPFLLTRRS